MGFSYETANTNHLSTRCSQKVQKKKGLNINPKNLCFLLKRIPINVQVIITKNSKKIDERLRLGLKINHVPKMLLVENAKT